MRKLFEYKKYLQLISMSSKSYLGANWDKRNKVILEKVIIKAIRYGLHNNMKEKIDIKDNNQSCENDFFVLICNNQNNCISINVKKCLTDFTTIIISTMKSDFKVKVVVVMLLN